MSIMSSTKKVADSFIRNLKADACIVDASGRQASIISQEDTSEEGFVWVQAENSAQVRVPLSILVLEEDGKYRLPFFFDVHSDERTPSRLIFPIAEESLHVGKRMIDTGKGIRLHKTVSEERQLIDQMLEQDELVVEHIAVDREVMESALPEMRYEGDTLVVPVLEEVLIVQKQWRIKEEVRITRHRHAVRSAQSMSIRKEQLAVERFYEGKKKVV